MRDHWRELGFWRWWWRNRVSFGAKAVLAVLLLAGVVVGGWFAAANLPSARAIAGESRTVERFITVHERRKVVEKFVPVGTVYVSNRAHPVTVTVSRASTVYGTRTVVRTAPSRPAKVVTRPARTVVRNVTRTVFRVVTKTVPVVQWRYVTVVQKAATVTVTVTTP